MRGGMTLPDDGLPQSCPIPLARYYDLAVLDLDGVLYLGSDAVPGAPQTLRTVREAGMRACFLTNNASRTAATVADHLTRIGIPATADEVVTAAQVAAAMLARRLPPGAAVLVIGGEGLRVALREKGLCPVESVGRGPQAVVQGFAPDLTWRELAEGAHAVRSGLFWVATNLDLTIPTPRGPAPGNGALVGLVAGTAGREPDAVAGKPRPDPFREAATRHGSNRPLVVGDRLDTDLEGARAAGQDGLLVMTGVSDARDVLGCPPRRRPSYLGRDLAALLQPHPRAAVRALACGPAAGLRARCGAATVALGDGGYRVERAGNDALDLLRAAAVAAWTRADGVRAAGLGAPASDDPDPGPVLDALHQLEPGITWAR